MEDFDALASSLAAGLGDVRGCLVLSRDGLVLGSSPAGAEANATPAWVRFAALGDTERGFAQFGAESWCYVRRGPYAAFAVVGPGARPGLVLDQMDQALLAAEQARAQHEVFGPRAVESTPPTTRPRTLLHPEPNPGKEPVVIDVPRTPAAAEASTDMPSSQDPDLGFAPLPSMFEPAPAAPAAEAPAKGTDAEPAWDWQEPGTVWPKREPGPTWPEPDLDLASGADEVEVEMEDAAHEADDASEHDPSGWESTSEPGSSGSESAPESWEPEADEQDDVDRFSLAQEFGQLLQRGEDPADG